LPGDQLAVVLDELPPIGVLEYVAIGPTLWGERFAELVRERTKPAQA
jgi:hypothetical protein